MGHGCRLSRAQAWVGNFPPASNSHLWHGLPKPSVGFFLLSHSSDGPSPPLLPPPPSSVPWHMLLSLRVPQAFRLPCFCDSDSCRVVLPSVPSCKPMHHNDMCFSNLNCSDCFSGCAIVASSMVHVESCYLCCQSLAKLCISSFTSLTSLDANSNSFFFLKASAMHHCDGCVCSSFWTLPSALGVPHLPPHSLMLTFF